MRTAVLTTAYLPLVYATETTMEEFNRAVLLAERDLWLARWNTLRGVHSIVAQPK